VIIAVDQTSLDLIDTAEGYKRGWPWPRKYWGSLTEYLSEDCHAKAVIFDILFSEHSVNPGEEGKSDDELFAQSIERARKEGPAALVFAVQFRPDGKLTSVIPPVKPPPLTGAIDISSSEKWRTYRTTERGEPSLALSALRGAKLEPKLPPERPFLLHYYGPHKTRDGRQTFRYVNAANVIFVSYGDDEKKWQIDKEMFRNKIVLIDAALGSVSRRGDPGDGGGEPAARRSGVGGKTSAGGGGHFPGIVAGGAWGDLSAAGVA